MTGLLLLALSGLAWPSIPPQYQHQYDVSQYKIAIQWYPKDSLANKISNYRHNNGWWIDMVTTMLQEKWDFNRLAISSTNDYWLCQLHYNKTNAVWINDPRWKADPMRQAKICLEKWKAVQNKNLWSGYAIRHKHLSKIKFM